MPEIDKPGYTPAGVFRRTPAERADQELAWRRPDQAFFAAGACHIHRHRLPEQFHADPRPRARANLDRYPTSPA